MKYTVYPRAIEIQTISACNAKCVICPHPEVSKELPSGVMGMSLFVKIVNQIDSQWNCRIIPYLNSEPMLDPFIIYRLRHISSRFKTPEIELSTNVSALTPTKQGLMTGIHLKELRLSVFGFTESTHKRIMPGLRWAGVKENLDYLVTNKPLRKTIDQISVVMIDHPMVTTEDIDLVLRYCKVHSLKFNHWGFLDRAGNVKDYSNSINRKIITGCEQRRPLERMHITFTGDVILCCQDWRWKNVIGNVNEQSLTEIWNSDTYNRYRKSIYAGTGHQPEICSRCKLSITS